MYESIWENREWIFSGVGVAALALVSAIFRRLFRSKGRTAPSHVTVVQITESAKSSAVANPEQGSGELTKVTRISALSFDEILEVVKDAPPLQIEAVGERFKGTTVQWRTQIYSLEKRSRDTVQIGLHFGEGRPGLIYCSVSLDKYKELAYLKPGTPVTVQGEIEAVRKGYVDLKNAELFFTEGSAPKPRAEVA